MWKLKKSQCLGFLADEMNPGKRKRKLSAQRAGLPGDVNMTRGSALTPLRESVTALLDYLPTAGRQVGAPSRLAREKLTG
jgi:hypothetical protein